jgi:hypothetical protein
MVNDFMRYTAYPKFFNRIDSCAPDNYCIRFFFVCYMQYFCSCISFTSYCLYILYPRIVLTVIEEVRSKVENYLNERGYNREIITNFARRFNSEIENKANDDNDIKKFRMWWAIQQQNKDLVKYLQYVEDMKHYALSLDKKPLHQYYIQHKAVCLSYIHGIWRIKLLEKDIRTKLRI